MCVVGQPDQEGDGFSHEFHEIQVVASVFPRTLCPRNIVDMDEKLGHRLQCFHKNCEAFKGQ